MKVRILPRVPIWKAGRYKLAAPVSKTGSASPRSERYRRLPPGLLTLNQRNSHETRSPLPKPVALPQELQTQSSGPPHQAGEVEYRIPPGALRSETANQNCLVAQKQSTRLITGRPRSVTARDNQSKVSGARYQVSCAPRSDST